MTQLKQSAAGPRALKSNLVMLSPPAAMLCIQTLALKDPLDHAFIC
jgi:hypothetical protein